MAKFDSNVVVAAFTEDQVERLTRVTKNRLQYWDRTGFFALSLADENRRRPYSRIYSFKDVVCLKVLKDLRDELRVSLPHLREVKDSLAHLGDDMWGKTTLFVLNRRIVFVNPETERKEDVISGQGVLQIPLKVARGNMQKAVRALRERDPSTVGKVQRKRGVVSKKPVVAGTRIPVAAIKAFKEAGYSIKRIREQYPSLTAKDIQAALKFDEAA